MKRSMMFPIAAIVALLRERQFAKNRRATGR